MQNQDNAIDFLKENLQKHNKIKYLQTVKQTICQPQSSQSTEQQMSSVLQKYEERYQKFMHLDNLMISSKSNSLIDECLNSVHPGLKTKKDCKLILAIMSKIFVQQLIEESFEVLEEYKAANRLMDQHSTLSNGKNRLKRSQQIDVDVIEEAYRRRLLKKQKI